MRAAAPVPESHAERCLRCGAPMDWRHQTWQCPRCRFKLGCCEGESPEACAQQRTPQTSRGVAPGSRDGQEVDRQGDAAGEARPGVRAVDRAVLVAIVWLIASVLSQCAQILGAVLGALMLHVVFPSEADLAGGVPTLDSGVTAFGGLVLEAILTFFLVWVIFACAADPKGAFGAIAGLAIGGTITLDILIGGPLTGAAMNPARAFGPQLVENVWSDGWIYYAGPLAGAAAAALLYDVLYLRKVPRTA